MCWSYFPGSLEAQTDIQADILTYRLDRSRSCFSYNPASFVPINISSPLYCHLYYFLILLHNAILNQKMISKKETILNPRQRPKSPPRLAMKSKSVILLRIWYSGDTVSQSSPTLNWPNTEEEPKYKLTTARSRSRALYWLKSLVRMEQARHDIIKVAVSTVSWPPSWPPAAPASWPPLSSSDSSGGWGWVKGKSMKGKGKMSQKSRRTKVVFIKVQAWRRLGDRRAC